MPRLENTIDQTAPAQQRAIKTFTLRARVHAASIAPGDYLRSKSGKSAYLVSSVTKLRTAGEPSSTNRLRVVCSKATPPPDATVHPWAEAPLVPPTPPRPVLVSVTQTPEEATSIRVKMRDARQQARVELADRVREWKTGEPLIPAIRKQAIMAPDGKRVLRPPTAVNAVWRDPEDTNRSSRRPREIAGWRSHDPLVTLSKRNSNVTEELIHAADCYRLTWENGPGGARPGYEPPLLQNHNFGPSSGPSEARAFGEIAWQDVQRYIGERGKLSILDHVVIRCGDITAWAERNDWDRKAAVGYLIGALETLLSFYRHEVASRMRGDDPEVEQERRRAAR